MDLLGYCSLAHVRILLLPVGPIKQATYNHWVSEIKTFENIRLGDIPADTREDRARFMPNPLAQGHIHLSFPSHPLPQLYSQLALFRLSDFPLGVIGLATCSQSEMLPSILSQFRATVAELFPEGSTFPLAKNCFVFEEIDDDAPVNLANLPGLVVIPGMMGNKTLYVGTLLADLCSAILAEFATVVQALETPLGNEYLNAGLFPTMPSMSEMPKPLDNDAPLRNSLPPLPVQHSQPDLATGSAMLRAKTPNSLQLKRNSSVGPTPQTSPYRHASLPIQNAKKRQTTIGAVSSHGRLFKVLGDFFLLAGRTMDASVWYNEAIAMMKGTPDSVWNAAALEGLATIPILDAWSAGHADSMDGGESETWSEIAEKLTQAVSLYHKTTPAAEPESNYTYVSWFYARVVLRHTSLLYAVWCARGWGLAAMNNLLQSNLSAPPTPEADSGSGERDKKRLSYSVFESLTTATGISRSMIASTLSQVHGPWLLHLGARERVTVLERAASLYGILGYPRKEAYILREVLGCIMDLIVCGREEVGGTRIAGAGLGIQGVDLGSSTQQGSVAIRTNDVIEGNESILRIVKHVCKVHGIDLEAVKLTSQASTELASENSSGDSLLQAEPFGWPELQIGIVREAIAVAESLPDYPTVAQFSLSALKTLHLVMSQNDQHHLYGTANRALSTAKRRGDSRYVDYWSGQPVVSIEILPLPLVRLPMEKPISLLTQAADTVAPVLVGMTDPFLYNPRRQAAGQGVALLVQNEPFDVTLTLRNPFVFELELSSLTLSTSGVPIEAKALALLIPANKYQPVTITVQALEPGELTIRGCIVQAPGGAPREFVLPAATGDEESLQESRRSAVVCETGRSKRSGLDARPWEIQEKRMSIPGQKTPPQFVKCKVVPEQPLLRIRRTSLTHGAVMLYDGERSSIRLTLENVSALPIDFIHLTFDDSTAGPAQQALAEGDLSGFDTYETEYDLIQRPVFTWDKKRNEQEIHPGGKLVLTVGCFGKVGCTSGTIHIAYSYCHRPQVDAEDAPSMFHTRQLSYPVLVTVYHMLECLNMEILPYSAGSISFAEHDGLGPSQRKPLEVQNPDDWCLFSVEVRNTYGIPFEVTFECAQPDAPAQTIVTLVPPGSTTRILVPLHKFRLSDEDVSKPIPTLSDRQFVVAKENLSSSEEAMQRELFWYREELFKRVRGRWKETGGARSGDLSLRQQRLTLPMLNVLQVEDVRLEMSLWHDDGDGRLIPIKSAAGFYAAPLDQFVYLRTKVINLSSKPFTLTANVSIEPDEHALYEGVLSEIPIGQLEERQHREFEIPLTFMACGRFELVSEVFVLADDSRVGQGRLRAVVQ